MVRFVNHKIPNEQELVDPLSLNLYTYCHNNPVYYTDASGNFAIPTWAKITIGVAGIAGAVALTVATGGAAAPALIAAGKVVAVSMATGAAIGAGAGAVVHRLSTGGWEGAGDAALQSAGEGAIDGFMWGGIASAGSAAVKGVQVGGKTVVYTSKTANGTTQYVGITDNLARRYTEHLSQKKNFYWKTDVWFKSSKRKSR